MMHATIKQKSIEKRKFQRKKCSLHVAYSDNTVTHRRAIISDIHQGGAFINTRNRLDIGEDFLMKVHLPGLPMPMAIIGEVVRYNSDGMGVKFDMEFGASAINSFIRSI